MSRTEGKTKTREIVNVSIFNRNFVGSIEWLPDGSKKRYRTHLRGTVIEKDGSSTNADFCMRKFDSIAEATKDIVDTLGKESAKINGYC